MTKRPFPNIHCGRVRLWRALLLVLIAGAALFLLWWEGAFLPAYTVWNETGDLTVNGIRRDAPARPASPSAGNTSSSYSSSDTENGTAPSAEIETDPYDLSVHLKGRRAVLLQNGDPVFRTERGFKVSSLAVADLSGDGTDEIILLVWKHGSHGNDRPFWVKRDTLRFSQHVFLYNVSAKEDGSLFLRPLWMSSALGFPIANLRTEERLLILRSPDGSESTWAWETFGLKLRS